MMMMSFFLYDLFRRDLYDWHGGGLRIIPVSLPYRFLDVVIVIFLFLFLLDVSMPIIALKWSFSFFICPSSLDRRI
jgi:hypothetical protein